MGSGRVTCRGRYTVRLNTGYGRHISLEGLQRTGQMRRMDFLLCGQLNCVRFLDLDQTEIDSTKKVTSPNIALRY